jgi:hypothetical protein
MDEQEVSQKEIQSLLRQYSHSLDFLIANCNRWLSEEEGKANVEKYYRERRKVEQRRRWRKVLKVFGIWLKVKDKEHYFFP